MSLELLKKNFHILIDTFIKQCEDLMEQNPKHKEWYRGNIAGLKTSKKMIEAARDTE